MTIKVKNGAVGTGSWGAAIVDGKVRLKWGGTTWKYPAMIRVKNGNVGGGAWVDSDYRGYPNEPRNINVGTWDNVNFENITIDWTAPVAGGAPVAHYEVEMRGAQGALLATKTPTAPPTSNFDVEQNSKVQFRMRSVTAAGLVSDWTPYLQVLMGHKEQGHYKTENRTRDWYREVNGPWYRDAYTGGETVIKVPVDVVIKRFHYNLWSQGGFTSVLSPYGSREVKMVTFSVDYGTKTMGSPFEKIEYGIDLQGTGTWFGLRCRGDGWSSTAAGPYKMLGTFGITGTETYQVQVYVMDVAYKANSYW